MINKKRYARACLFFCRTKGAVSQAYLTNFSEDIPYNEFCLSTKSILRRKRKKVGRVL
ncbi:hypothetical protein CLONEX_00129 [[Clostridium] nexile DSM 1787]|nr:hypothetical protein CLONEX_00129 [[Clostridium] nexile DSM 1787]